MKKFLTIFSMFLATILPVSAEQVLPDAIFKNTITISAPKTGELGKNYYFCKNGNKCSTEQVVREYYNNNGYNVMRAEYLFWKGMFVLTFFTAPFFFGLFFINLITDISLSVNFSVTFSVTLWVTELL